MKITIDTDSKEITIHGNAEFHELVKFYENFPEIALGKVKYYRIRQEKETIKEIEFIPNPLNPWPTVTYCTDKTQIGMPLDDCN